MVGGKAPRGPLVPPHAGQNGPVLPCGQYKLCISTERSETATVFTLRMVHAEKRGGETYPSEEVNPVCDHGEDRNHEHIDDILFDI